MFKNSLDVERVKELVKCNDPVPLLFQWLVELWNASGVEDDLLNDYYDDREKSTRLLTETLEQVYAEFLAKKLLPQVSSHQVGEVLAQPRYALVLM